MHRFVSRLANRATYWAGTPTASMTALLSLILYAAVGGIFGFTTSYNLVANTVMSAVSYLMLFLLQHGQNHHSLATQLKIDELIRSRPGASDSLIAIEDLTEDDLRLLAERARSGRN